MPLVFSTQIDSSTLSPEDFRVITVAGAVKIPSVATLSPADEPDERRTVLLTGPLGTSDDPPNRVLVVGSLMSVDGVELRGNEIKVTPNSNGPSLVWAVYDPPKPEGEDSPSQLGRIQTTWQGGVTGRFGSAIGPRLICQFHIIDSSGAIHRPLGFEDSSDNDNHLILLVPPGVEPSLITVAEATVYDPTNQPNPATSIDVMELADLQPDSSANLQHFLRFFFKTQTVDPFKYLFKQFSEREWASRL